ncbi:MAG: hypothetical protein ABWZ76_04735 [Acidimicrobiales bacterium]
MRHRQTATTLPRRSLQHPARDAGFRSVELVRVARGPGRTVAEVTGVLHRYPQTVRVSLATATRLVAAGAPLRLDGPERTLVRT